jgi:peptidoglycan/LPS O-acetylase OafA/YrhL
MDLASLAHCWSLAIEEQYYLIWPLIIYSLEKNILRYSTKAFLLLSMAILLALYRASMVGFLDPSRIYFALDTHMDGLVLGSSLSYFVLEFQSKKLSLNKLAYFWSFVITPIAITGLVILMYSITWRSPWMGKLGYFGAATASAIIIADLVLSPKSLFRKILSIKPITYIGRISYGLYLLHFPIFLLVRELTPGPKISIRIPLQLGISLLAAIASFHLIELPFLKLKRRFTNKR